MPERGKPLRDLVREYGYGVRVRVTAWQEGRYFHVAKQVKDGFKGYERVGPIRTPTIWGDQADSIGWELSSDPYAQSRTRLPGRAASTVKEGSGFYG